MAGPAKLPASRNRMASAIMPPPVSSLLSRIKKKNAPGQSPEVKFLLSKKILNEVDGPIWEGRDDGAVPYDLKLIKRKGNQSEEGPTIVVGLGWEKRPRRRGAWRTTLECRSSICYHLYRASHWGEG